MDLKKIPALAYYIILIILPLAVSIGFSLYNTINDVPDDKFYLGAFICSIVSTLAILVAATFITKLYGRKEMMLLVLAWIIVAVAVGNSVLSSWVQFKDSSDKFVISSLAISISVFVFSTIYAIVLTKKKIH